MPRTPSKIQILPKLAQNSLSLPQIPILGLETAFCLSLVPDPLTLDYPNNFWNSKAFNTALS